MADKDTKTQEAPPKPKQAPDAPADADAPEEEPKPIPSEGDDAYDTPSGYAIAQVGETDAEPGTQEAKEHGDEYAKEKSKKRWGYTD